jgi:hypothetical protein
MPANIGPKHAGHAMAVSAEPQYSQRAESAVGAGAPQEGQFSDETIRPREPGRTKDAPGIGQSRTGQRSTPLKRILVDRPSYDS